MEERENRFLKFFNPTTEHNPTTAKEWGGLSDWITIMLHSICFIIEI